MSLKNFVSDSELSLNSEIEYLEQILNKDSATNHRCIENLKALKLRASYLNKYIDVTIDFYKLENKS